MAENQNEKETLENQVPETEVCDEKATDKKKNCKKQSGDKKEKKLLEQIGELEVKLCEENDKHLRMMAEYENFRKRVAKEKETIYSDAVCDTAAQLLPMLDNLERALASESDKESSMYKGVEMIMKQCEEIFTKMGISEIEAMGKTFDPNLHNAVMHDEDETKGESEITAVFQKGYTRGDKVLRYSVVKVSN